MGMIHLVLGGARSGKSRFALQAAEMLALQQQLDCTFVATATALDDEMAARIQRHQQERSQYWQLAEVPLALEDYFVKAEGAGVVLVDCLTMWLNNQLYHYPDQDFAVLFRRLIAAMQNSRRQIVLVANEVGLGVIPMGEITRRFVDQAGWLNQAVAAAADRVTLITAGLPLTLKGG